MENTQMHINEIEAIANRLRSLQRRTYRFGKDRAQIIAEIGMIAADLEKQVAKWDADMELEYLADHAEYVRG